jgi:short-subunit dehydrogenase
MQPRVALITGASSGIGAAAAREFTRAGASVALAARRYARLEALARDLGPNALPIRADLAQQADIENMVAQTLARFGRIDVLFNNAGFGRLNWLEALSPDEIEAQVRVNLLGVIHASRQVLPVMMRQRGGHIINMASLAGLIGAPTYSVYGAAKFAVRGFSEALRREVRPFGVHVSLISPAGVPTEFAEHAGLRRVTGLTTPGWLRLSAEETARAVVHLARHPRPEVILPWPMAILAELNRWFPTLSDWIVVKVFTERERQPIG